MAGDSFPRLLAAVETAKQSLIELAELLVEMTESEGATFPAPGGMFEVDETSVQPVALKECELRKDHASHLWFEGDNVAPWDCPGVGAQHPNMMCENPSMHDGHTWSDRDGIKWCQGMPF